MTWPPAGYKKWPSLRGACGAFGITSLRALQTVMPAAVTAAGFQAQMRTSYQDLLRDFVDSCLPVVPHVESLAGGTFEWSDPAGDTHRRALRYTVTMYVNTVDLFTEATVKRAGSSDYAWELPPLGEGTNYVYYITPANAASDALEGGSTNYYRDDFTTKFPEEPVPG